MIFLVFLVFFIILSTFIGIISKDKKIQFFMALMICFLYSLFWSFQPIGHGHDIDRYYAAYNSAPLITNFTPVISNYGLVYTSTMSFIKTLGFSFTGFLFITFFIVSIVYLISFKIISKNYLYGVSATLLLSDTFISMIRLQRQGVAVALLFLSSILLYINRKKLSLMFLPLMVSLHVTFIPIYLAIITALHIVKKSFFIKFLTMVIVLFGLYILSTNIKVVYDIFELLQYDSGKYHAKAEVYIDNAEKESGLGAGYLLLVMITFISTIDTYLVHKNNKNNKNNFFLLNQFVSSLLIFNTSLLYFTSELSVIARLALYLAPFYALGLLLVLDSLKNMRLFFMYFSLIFLGVFYTLKIYFKDMDRIPIF